MSDQDSTKLLIILDKFWFIHSSISFIFRNRHMNTVYNFVQDKIYLNVYCITTVMRAVIKKERYQER